MRSRWLLYLQVARVALKESRVVEHEARLREALKRSQRPPFHRRGKPIMLRSHISHNPIAQQDNIRQFDGELEQYIERIDWL